MLNKIRDGLLALADALASIMLIILTAITFVDVVGRNLFSHPLVGSNELTEYSLVFLTFLAYPVVAWKRQHIVVDLFDIASPDWLLRVQKMIGDLLGAVLFGLLAYRLWFQALRLKGYGDMTPQLMIPVYYAYYFMSVMAAVTALVFVLSAFHRRLPADDTKKLTDEVV